MITTKKIIVTILITILSPLIALVVGYLSIYVFIRAYLTEPENIERELGI